MENWSSTTKLYNALFNKKIIPVHTNMNDFIKYGYYDVLTDVVESTGDMEYFINVINMVPMTMSPRIMFSVKSTKIYDEKYDVFYSNSKYLNKMYDLNKINIGMSLYIILKRINNLDSLKHIWNSEYTKDKQFYEKMMDNIDKYSSGETLLTLFKYSLTYKFVNFFFEIDSVANWKPFIHNNFSVISHRFIVSKNFGKILPLLVKYIRKNSDLLDSLQFIQELRQTVQEFSYRKINSHIFYNLSILLEKINMIYIANVFLFNTDSLSEECWRKLANYGHINIRTYLAIHPHTNRLKNVQRILFI